MMTKIMIMIMLKRLFLLFYLRPDPELPSIDSRLPANREPNVKTPTFLKKASDGKWKNEAFQKFVDKFHPKWEYDEYFLPCKMPLKLV